MARTQTQIDALVEKNANGNAAPPLGHNNPPAVIETLNPKKLWDASEDNEVLSAKLDQTMVQQAAACILAMYPAHRKAEKSGLDLWKLTVLSDEIPANSARDNFWEDFRRKMDIVDYPTAKLKQDNQSQWEDDKREYDRNKQRFLRALPLAALITELTNVNRVLNSPRLTCEKALEEFYVVEKGMFRVPLWAFAVEKKVTFLIKGVPTSENSLILLDSEYFSITADSMFRRISANPTELWNSMTGEKSPWRTITVESKVVNPTTGKEETRVLPKYVKLSKPVRKPAPSAAPSAPDSVGGNDDETKPDAAANSGTRGDDVAPKHAGDAAFHAQEVINILGKLNSPDGKVIPWKQLPPAEGNACNMLLELFIEMVDAQDALDGTTHGTTVHGLAERIETMNKQKDADAEKKQESVAASMKRPATKRGKVLAD